MGDFSVGRTIGAGFRLIGREPAAFLAWAAAYLVVGLLPQIGIMALILPEWGRMAQEIASSGAGHPPMSAAQMMQLQGGMMQLQPLSWIASIVSQTLLLSAVYRAVLFPQDRSFLYLRLGGRELWLGLVMLVLFVMAFILMFVVMLPTALILGILSALAHNTAALGVLGVLVIFLALGAILWVLLRLSLATPMSFDQRAFRLYESWDLTRGHAAKIFLVALVLALIVLAVEIALMGAVIGFAGGLAALRQLGPFFQHPHLDLARLAPWIAAGAVVASLLSAWVFTIFGAAWAEIYRELTMEPDGV